MLNEPGDEIRNIYFLAGGVVSKFAVFDDGHEVECVLVGRNSAIGTLAALGFNTGLTRDVCIFDTQAWSLPRSRLVWACKTSPRIARAVAHSCRTQMTYAIRVGACNALHGVEQRLSRWLLSCCALLQAPEIALGQELLAKVLGVQRSSVNPMLQRFQADGLIALGRSRVTIVDAAGLRRRVCECFGALELRAHGHRCEHETAQPTREPPGAGGSRPATGAW